jgi:diguanylate cyclase (GGDEF)-like protein
VLSIVQRKSFGAFLRSYLAPIATRAPAAIADELVLLQYERLRAHMPALCLAVSLTSIAATLSLLGEIPYILQFSPPAILVTACFILFIRWRKPGPPMAAEAARRVLGAAPILAGALGLVAGLWCVNAFTETEKYYCVVAPVFVALSVLMAANCLSSVPGAATVAVFGASTPIAIKMLLFDNLGIRCIAVMMVVISAMQLRLIYNKFDETVRMIILQREMRLQAETDPLTRMSNRRAYNEKVAADLASRRAPIAVAMIDLDGFKSANDRFGHHAGDLILIEVAARLQRICTDTSCQARLGGDEFALLWSHPLSAGQLNELAGAIRAVLALPYSIEGNLIVISASVGTARFPCDGNTAAKLLHSADVALYADKASNRIRRKAA